MELKITLKLDPHQVEMLAKAFEKAGKRSIEQMKKMAK